MMKNTAALFTFLILYFISSSTIHAQTFDFTKAYQDYQYQLGLYQDSYNKYQEAKDFYIKSQTLTLKEDARKKTLAMLRNRDKLMSVYITMLRIKLVETKGLSTDDKNTIFGKIDPEVKWYEDHVSNYKDDDPLDSLFSKSKEAESRYKSLTLPISYESIFDITWGEELGIRQEHELIYISLKDTINTGVANGTLDINPFVRWFTDIDNVVNKLKDSDSKSKSLIQKVYGQNFSIAGSFNSATDSLAQSRNSLSDLNDFLSEVLVSIRNQQK